VLERLAAEEGFRILVSPWTAAPAPLAAIAASRTRGELERAAADPDFDYRPPTDARPFFFNMLRPARFHRAFGAPKGGVIWGNIQATGTLVVLFLLALAAVAAAIVWPLARAGRPPMPPRAFAATVAYFAAIGAGFMLVQIGFLQRFSVLLGHPTYALAVVLFAMILAAGVGSLLSDRLPLGRRLPLLPVAIALALLLVAALLGSGLRAGAGGSLAARTAIVLAYVVPVSLLLGACFPVGLRLAGRRAPLVTAWMWGVNGACGVLASIAAVGVSMWAGIDWNFLAAAALYLALVPAMRRLMDDPRAAGSPPAAERGPSRVEVSAT
jgi:hypothetical protein